MLIPFSPQIVQHPNRNCAVYWNNICLYYSSKKDNLIETWTCYALIVILSIYPSRAQCVQVTTVDFLGLPVQRRLAG